MKRITWDDVRVNWKVICIVIAGLICFTFPLPFLFDTSANLFEVFRSVILYEIAILAPILFIVAIVYGIKIILMEEY